MNVRKLDSRVGPKTDTDKLGDKEVSLKMPHSLCLLTSQHEDSSDREQEEAHQGDDTLEQHLKLLGIQLAAQVVHKGMDLAQTKHTKGCHVL